MEDMSLELTKAETYADFLREEINKLPPNGFGKFILSREQVEAFSWMLEDMGTTIFTVKKTFYPDQKEEKQ
ncbi:hypothetical protein [Geotalea toluenoxydans]